MSALARVGLAVACVVAIAGLALDMQWPAANGHLGRDLWVGLALAAVSAGAGFAFARLSRADTAARIDRELAHELRTSLAIIQLEAGKINHPGARCIEAEIAKAGKVLDPEIPP